MKGAFLFFVRALVFIAIRNWNTVSGIKVVESNELNNVWIKNMCICIKISINVINRHN